mmetsp:Transcript_54067/g.135999  ORF Transcript_54067/g.135999 Transcript_54067/m.135999 type:complete len:248 (-) Transcript_54067:103-846(-)
MSDCTKHDLSTESKLPNSACMQSVARGWVHIAHTTSADMLLTRALVAGSPWAHSLLSALRTTQVPSGWGASIENNATSSRVSTRDSWREPFARLDDSTSCSHVRACDSLCWMTASRNSDRGTPPITLSKSLRVTTSGGGIACSFPLNHRWTGRPKGAGPYDCPATPPVCPAPGPYGCPAPAVLTKGFLASRRLPWTGTPDGGQGRMRTGQRNRGRLLLAGWACAATPYDVTEPGVCSTNGLHCDGCL